MRGNDMVERRVVRGWQLRRLLAAVWASLLLLTVLAVGPWAGAAGAAPQTINQYLASAGPAGAGAPWAMISLGNFTANGPSVDNGNVAVASGAVVFNNPFALNGKLYVGQGVSYSSNITPTGGESSNPTLVSQAASDARAASSAFSALTSTQSVGTLGNNSSITASSSNNFNVIASSGVNITNGTLTLVGNSSSVFVINVNGNFTVSNGGVVLSGGVLATNVVWNISGNLTISGGGPATFYGTALDINGQATVHDDTWNGELIAGTITDTSGFKVNSFPPAPITQTIAGHIYLCSSGSPTTTEVAGGTLGATGPQTVATQANPLNPMSVLAGSYTMTETNPAGYILAAACGTTSPTQSVTVPPGGAGVGIFYVTPTTCQVGPGVHQTSSAFKPGVPSISTTLSSTPAAGDLLIVEVQVAEGTGRPTKSVTDGTLSFTQREDVLAPSNDNTDVSIWTLVVPCGGAGTTVTATPSSSPADMSIAVLEYPGLSGAIDGFSSASGFSTGGSVSSGTGAAAKAGDIVLGFEADSGWQVNLGADTSDGYVSQVNAQNNTVAEFLDESQVAASAGTYNAKATITYTSATAGDLQPYGFPGVPYVMGTVAFAPSSATTSAPVTIFGSATPATVDSGDGNAVELGVQFQSSVAGTVTGIRFYKAGANTGTHVGSLWTASGQLLGSATFTNETASGWQTVTFATPVAIAANTTYVAGYFAPNGHYSDTSFGLTSAVTSGPLTALANSSSVPNGVYGYSTTSTFPTSTFAATNYWVDVNFVPGS